VAISFLLNIQFSCPDTYIHALNFKRIVQEHFSHFTDLIKAAGHSVTLNSPFLPFCCCAEITRHVTVISFLVSCSSIGLAKAALESINGENLFGGQGASWSVIYVDIDAHNRNRTIFDTILPRESNSKVAFLRG